MLWKIPKDEAAFRVVRARAAHNRRRRIIGKLRATAKVGRRETVGGGAVLIYILKAATEITNFGGLNLNEIKLKIDVCFPHS